MVETLETATSWGNLIALRDAVRAALPAYVGWHVSHLYPTGASLYYTVLAAQTRRSRGAVARASPPTRPILGAGGTLTHHHAIGTDHAPWLAREVGELGSTCCAR